MGPEILARRAEIARAIEGQTACGLLERAAREFAGRPALSEQDHHDSERAAAGAVPPQDGTWRTLTWPRARERVLRLAASFEALGLAPGGGERDGRA